MDTHLQPESQKNEIQTIIDNMVFLLGLNSEIQLGDFIGVTPAAISQWKKRGKIPSKYQKLTDEAVARRVEAIDSIKGVSVSVQEVMDALGMKKDSTWIYQYKKKNPRLYELIEDGIRLEKIKAVNVAIKMAKS
jgi:hypothetical protein